MTQFDDAKQNAVNDMEQEKISDADLDQVNGAGLFDMFRDLLFRKDKDEDPDIVLLPLCPGYDSLDDRDKQKDGPRIVKL